MTLAYDRRGFLRTAAVTLAILDPAAAAAARSHRAPRLAQEGSFSQGVASGEPGRRAITLWTKLDGTDRRTALGVEVARDRGFRNVLHRARAVVRPRARRHRAGADRRPAAAPGRAVLLPLPHRARAPRPSAASGPRGRPTRASRCGSRSSPARSSSPATTTRTATSRARTSTSSSASATTSTSRRSRTRCRATRRCARTPRRPTARRRRSTSTARSTRSTTPTGCCARCGGGSRWR